MRYFSIFILLVVLNNFFVFQNLFAEKLENSNLNKQLFFGKTKFFGNSCISKELILRELQFNENDTWNKRKLDFSIKRLKNLKLFKNVSFECYEFSPGFQDIGINLIDHNPLNFQVRFGLIQNSQSFTKLPTTSCRAGFSFQSRNPFGLGDLLFADIDFSRFTRNLFLSYELPWIFNYPIRAQFKVQSYRFGQPLVTGSNKRIYEEGHDGFLINFNRLFEFYQFDLLTGIDFIKVVSRVKNLEKIIFLNKEIINRRIPYLIFEPKFVLNTIDDPINSQKGYQTIFLLRTLIALKKEKTSFSKLLFEQSFIHPLFDNLIGAFRFSFGHIFSSNFKNIIPLERFYLGGPDTLRGYEPNMVPPINSFEINKRQFWVPVGGKSMFNLNSELRFKLNKIVGGVLFNDIGFLSKNNLASISLKDIFGAYGLGIRLESPIGLIRFDIGFKWSKRIKNDKLFAWYLAFGQMF